MPPRSAHPLFRATALVAALCVLALGVFAASPGWHAGLHDHTDHPEHPAVPVDQADHACAVTLFASGITALVVFCLLMLVRPLVAGVIGRAVDEIIPSLPRYRLVPSHAPPSA